MGTELRIQQEVMVSRNLKPETTTTNTSEYKKQNNNISKKKSAASMAFLRKRVAFFPLWPLWTLWCLCVACLVTSPVVTSSTKKKAKFIEECTPRLFSREATEKHQRGLRGQREKNAMPFFQKGHRGRILFLLMNLWY